MEGGVGGAGRAEGGAGSGRRGRACTEPFKVWAVDHEPMGPGAMGPVAPLAHGPRPMDVASQLTLGVRVCGFEFGVYDEASGSSLLVTGV